MSEAGLSQEEEERRTQLIRKSLAARSSISTNSWASRSSYSTMATLEQVDREQTDREQGEQGGQGELERHESTRLKDDWKRWEAQIREERSRSCGQHPAVSAAPVNNAAVPILTVPTPSKHRSQDRTCSGSPMPAPSPPPLPAKHPGRAFRD